MLPLISDVSHHIYIFLIGFYCGTTQTQQFEKLQKTFVYKSLYICAPRRSWTVKIANCKLLKPRRGMNGYPSCKSRFMGWKRLVDTSRTPLNTIMDGWMAEARVIHSPEDRNEAWVDSFPSHVTMCTSCCSSSENLKKQPRNMMLGIWWSPSCQQWTVKPIYLGVALQYMQHCLRCVSMCV